MQITVACPRQLLMIMMIIIIIIPTHVDLPGKVRTVTTGDCSPVADELPTAVTITLYSLSAKRFCSITSV